MKLKISKQQARNYLIQRSFLDSKAKSVLEVLRKLTCIQVDPIATFGKSHELALWNRVGSLERQQIEIELYDNRTLFEYWLQLYSIIPIEYYPYLKTFMSKDLLDWRKDYYKEHKTQVKQVIEYLSKNEAIAAKDLAHIKPGRSVMDWKGKDSQKAFLEYLWDTGEVIITKRKSKGKLYDLTSDILDTKILNTKVSFQESLIFHLESSFRYLGLLRKTFINRHREYARKELRNLWKKYEQQEKIIEVEIEDCKSKFYILKDQLEELEQFKEINHRGLNILSPLDPLIIDRVQVKEIFDFSYKWEAYTPAIKRVYGHYSMPILFNGELVGQTQLIWKADKLKIAKLESKISNSEFKLNLENKIKELEYFLKA